ncbi:hypothetical protein [Arthrobacter tumbae]|uniref:hypothetical protein n=1 Tax=Arthrobacter tumbae TaxID=163874 RepID=UPI001958BFEE|nr:hypothetical protein [Arthrobacter tumbae]MBM7779881.1 hypothetical protein [Arthrobacter tumbae]
MGKSRIKPEDPFPEDLNQLEDNQVEVLNSKVHRQVEVEYVQEGTPDPETEHRQEEINEELDDRDLLSEVLTGDTGPVSLNNDAGTPEDSGSAETSVERNADSR